MQSLNRVPHVINTPALKTHAMSIFFHVVLAFFILSKGITTSSVDRSSDLQRNNSEGNEFTSFSIHSMEKDNLDFEESERPKSKARSSRQDNEKHYWGLVQSEDLAGAQEFASEMKLNYFENYQFVEYVLASASPSGTMLNYLYEFHSDLVYDTGFSNASQASVDHFLLNQPFNRKLITELLVGCFNNFNVRIPNEIFIGLNNTQIIRLANEVITGKVLSDTAAKFYSLAPTLDVHIKERSTPLILAAIWGNTMILNAIINRRDFPHLIFFPDLNGKTLFYHIANNIRIKECLRVQLLGITFKYPLFFLNRGDMAALNSYLSLIITPIEKGEIPQINLLTHRFVRKYLIQIFVRLSKDRYEDTSGQELCKTYMIQFPILSQFWKKHEEDQI